ncbi:MAG TPA: CopG family transcriptional regulator [Thermoanaerobaculia bacterium]
MAPTVARRATVYLDSDLHRALRLKAAAADRSISDLVNEAVKLCLTEDAEDLEAFEEREAEPVESFASFVKRLKRRGQL